MNYPLCHHYVDVYHRLLTEQVGIHQISVTNHSFPEDGNLLEYLQPITDAAWSTFIPYSPSDEI